MSAAELMQSMFIYQLKMGKYILSVKQVQSNLF